MGTNTSRTPKQDERSVTRTYRVAVRLGEDFVTLESTITLPPGATDDDIAQAIDLDQRIYAAQQEAMGQQVAGVRQQRAEGGAGFTPVPDDPPASDKQVNFIATLRDAIGWGAEGLADYAAEQGVDLARLTKPQAKLLIDGLVAIRDGLRDQERRERQERQERQERPASHEQSGSRGGKGAGKRGAAPYTPQEIAPGEPPLAAAGQTTAVAVASTGGAGEPEQDIPF